MRAKNMTTTIAHQVHEKFKLFSGKLASDGTLGDLATEVAAWAKEAKVAPKSIGIEYVESADRVIFSIGYRDDEPGYPITVKSVAVGKLSGFSEGELAGLEKAMATAAAASGHLICHELYVTAKNDLLMVLMSHAA
jgi:hypothetical protein